MTRKKHKLFWSWEFEKEEKWLNEMAANGLHLVDVGFCRYVFEEGAPSEYAVRLQLLDTMPTSEKGKDYIRFVTDSGAAYIGSIFRWVYFKKKTDDGEFHLFSDIDSRLKQINALMSMFFLLTLADGMIFLSRALDFHNQSLSLPTVIALGIVVCLLAYASLKIWFIRRRLLKARVLRE